MPDNKNDGLFDKYELIDSCIVTLGNLRVTVRDMAEVGKPVVDVINRLSALKQGLRNEEQKGA